MDLALRCSCDRGLSCRCIPETALAARDPKETSALEATTAAMKPGADIASIVSVNGDAADFDRPRPSRPGKMLPSRCRTVTSSNSPSPTSSLISAWLGSRRLLRRGRLASPTPGTHGLSLHSIRPALLRTGSLGKVRSLFHEILIELLQIGETMQASLHGAV